LRSSTRSRADAPSSRSRDGEDTFSQTASLDSVIAAARTAALPIHTLGLGTEDSPAGENLRRMAVDTRGQHYSAQDAGQLRAIYEQLAERLRSSFTLVYRTERKIPDGTLRPCASPTRVPSKPAKPPCSSPHGRPGRRFGPRCSWRFLGGIGRCSRAYPDGCGGVNPCNRRADESGCHEFLETRVG